MNCHVCGGQMRPMTTDLPFKVDVNHIVVLKGLPVLQCDNCREFLLSDEVMARVDTLLETRSDLDDIEIVNYAA